MLKTATIEELTQDGAIRYGVVQPGKHYEGGVPFLKAGDIGNCSVNVTPEFKIAPEISDKYKRSILCGGEILITLVGNPGAVSIAPPDVAGFNVARAVGVLNVNSEVDNRFLCYALQGKSAQDQIHSLLNTTVQATLNLSDLKKIEISVPEVASQKAIAHILGTLDDKIELNQKMNQTLEEIAKAIFKSWFVDFDPVRAKAEGRPTGLPPEISDLFPDGLVDSEIGEIPKGWETTFLSNQLSFVLGGDWGKADESDATPHECRCVRGADIANLQQFVWSDMPTRYLKESSFHKRSLQDWDIVFEISGGSPTQSTGRSVLITKQLLNAYEASVTASNFCRLLRFSDPQTALFHYQKFRSSYDRDEFFMYETGTTGIKNFGFKYYSEDIPYVLPPSALLDEFFEIAQPMIEKAGINMRENMVLSELRDTLLPKLISGELRIPDAEKFLEEAGI